MNRCRSFAARLQSEAMILVRFKDRETELDALGLLVTEDVALKTWRNGETALPEGAVIFLDREGIEYEVVGRADYERLTPIRNLAAEAV